MRLLPARSCRADSFRTKPSEAIAASTFARVIGLTTSGRFSTFDTVPKDTPAAAATAFTPAACCFAFRRRPVPSRTLPALRPDTPGSAGAEEEEGEPDKRVEAEAAWPDRSRREAAERDELVEVVRGARELDPVEVVRGDRELDPVDAEPGPEVVGAGSGALSAGMRGLPASSPMGRGFETS
ncbi:hypothetical protein GCM10009743_71320 [Kribbella swartbergensis]